ncbi:hypothetical protein AK830_g979 [Neonectria ditissima]|uniref:Uncharacterized protein n=1 Tax=Neonectria ditissima TaxID=78410 RepID=A0A0P7BXN5_9HYPO|nr:hypothetical protein AK830_g979 [Neonectria ditissima]
MDTKQDDKLALPQEVILLIVESLAPDNPRKILTPSDERTKTLLTLTRTCKLTSSTASKLLWRYCTYIDSIERLRTFSQALDNLSSKDPRRPISLFLGLLEKDGAGSPKPWPCGRNRPEWPPEKRLKDDKDHALQVQKLLVKTAPTLQRLTIDMCTEELRQELGDLAQTVLAILRIGFKALVNLEEFVCIGDSFDFGGPQNQLWATCWPKLRCVSLDIQIENGEDYPIFGQMVRLPTLETAALTMLVETPPIVNEFLEGLVIEFEKPSTLESVPDRKFLTVAIPGINPEFDDFDAAASGSDPRAQVFLIDLCHFEGRAELFQRGGDTSYHLTTRWIRQTALNGTLWERARVGSGSWSGCTPTEDFVNPNSIHPLLYSSPI